MRGDSLRELAHAIMAAEFCDKKSVAQGYWDASSMAEYKSEDLRIREAYSVIFIWRLKT